MKGEKVKLSKKNNPSQTIIIKSTSKPDDKNGFLQNLQLDGQTLFDQTFKIKPEVCIYLYMQTQELKQK